MPPQIHLFLCFLMILGLSSCEDKAMVAKHKEQTREMKILREELTSLKERIDDKPMRDPSAKLEAEERNVEEKKLALTDLEEELTEMKADRKEAEKSFMEYKAKYPLGE